MSIGVLILGESGTGKTASLRNIDPEKTLLIQAVRKPLPFKANGWQLYDKDTKTGNTIVTDSSETIVRAMRAFDHPIVIIDDWQYILANEYMRRSDEKGFDKFSDIGKHAWDVLRAATDGRKPYRRTYILAHTQTDDFGRTRIKTIGKLLDDKITIEGLVTICLRTSVVDGQYKFLTQNNGLDTVKSPMGMFDEPIIDNDLDVVDKAICRYYNMKP